MRRKKGERQHHERVLDWLRTHKSGLTSKIAMEDLGIVQLPSVIFKLRRMGYWIRSVPFTTNNRYGQQVRCVRYFLDK